MPQRPNSQGILFTVGGRTANDRWQCVIPMVANGALDPNQTRLDFRQWFETPLKNAWILVLADDSELLGWQITGMVEGLIVPERANYPAGTYVGAVAGGSCPPGSSGIMAFYSSEQAVSGDPRTRVGRNNVGPIPEGSQAGGVLDNGYIVNLAALGLEVLQFTGGVTGTIYTRALSANNAPAGQVWPCDFRDARANIGTQRRRMVPFI